MKTLTLLLTLIVFLIGCGGESGDGVNVTDPSTPIINDPETPDIEPSPGPAKFVFFREDKVWLYDGTVLTVWNNGHAVHAGERSIATGTVLYTLDDYGNITGQENILITACLGYKSGADYWSVFRITPEEALDAGYFNKHYTQVYKNSTEVGSWPDRDYYTHQISGYGSDVFIRYNQSWFHVNGAKAPHIVYPDFFIEDFNSTARTAKINGVSVSWSNNFMNVERQWQKTDGGWISARGYFFDGSVLYENGNKLTDWRGTPYPIADIEGPVLIAAGTRNVNGDLITYWIECNSGWLVAYNIRLNTITQAYRLYVGDNTRASGLQKASHLNPVMSGDLLLIGDGDGYMYEYSFTTGLVRQIYMNPIWIVRW